MNKSVEHFLPSHPAKGGKQLRHITNVDIFLCAPGNHVASNTKFVRSICNQINVSPPSLRASPDTLSPCSHNSPTGRARDLSKPSKEESLLGFDLKNQTVPVDEKDKMDTNRSFVSKTANFGVLPSMFRIKLRLTQTTKETTFAHDQ